MKQPGSTISTFTRLVSVGMLLLWLTAVAHCTDTCCSDGPYSPPTPDSSHAAAKATTTPSHHANQAGHHDPDFCDSLHSVCPVFPSAAVARPDFGCADSPIFVFNTTPVISTSFEAVIRRQPPDPFRVFTPEVCLGPALHSLAPPVSSLS